MVAQDFSKNITPIIATITRIFLAEGKAREVEVLANAQARVEESDYDNWDGGTYWYIVYLHVPLHIYLQLGDEREIIEKSIIEKAQLIVRSYSKTHLDGVFILPLETIDDDWQNKANNWLNGKGVTNQGRVRSDNIAQMTCDGLLFRSEPEILLYKALKGLGVSFAPLPVFIRGGQEYRRIEPDFVIIKDGLLMVVEVDGDTVHKETPAEAHARTTMLVHEGAYLERIKASQCNTPEAANASAKMLLQILDKLKASR